MNIRAYKQIRLSVLYLLFLCSLYVLPQLCTTQLLSTENCLLSCDNCDDVSEHLNISQNNNLGVDIILQRHGRHVSRFKYKIKPIGLAFPSIVNSLDEGDVISDNIIIKKASTVLITPYYYIFLFRYTLF